VPSALKVTHVDQTCNADAGTPLPRSWYRSSRQQGRLYHISGHFFLPTKGSVGPHDRTDSCKVVLKEKVEEEGDQSVVVVVHAGRRVVPATAGLLAFVTPCS
jgi:hypothetical protein